jgi:hypothetical protein
MAQNEYDANKRPDKVYVSPSLPAYGNPERRVRIVSKVVDSPEDLAFAIIKKEVILRYAPGDRRYIKAAFYEDNRAIRGLTIQGFTAATDKPNNSSFTLRGEEIGTLIEFLNTIHTMPLDGPGRINVRDNELRKMILSPQQASAILELNEDVLAEALKSRVTKEDLVAVGYRKKQLDTFARLLDEPQFFADAVSKRKTTAEGLWQQFFEKNTWMFGYGLGYLFLSNLDGKKLEQVVQGFTVGEYGKRTDGLLKTRGAISHLCFVEIKTHDTPLLAGGRPYRAGCWSPSSDLSGAVAQVQGTVHSAVVSLGERYVGRDPLGNPTGEEAFNFQPKSYLVVGSLKQFTVPSGVNSDQVRSFELFRRSTTSPEIITFDELYERARFIVNHNG